MATVPDKITEKLAFFEQHLPVWIAKPTEIGISAAQVANLATLVVAARDAYEATVDARQASKTATTTQNFALDAMSEFGGDLIKTIRAYAETTNNTDVYDIAQIPPPAAPTPAGPPEQPTNLTASLLTPFGLGLNWKGSVAQGAYFGIWRKINGESSFSFIGTTKNKSFDDTTVPAGTNSVLYYITAYRDEFSVNSGVLSIQFSAGGTTSIALAA